MKRIVIIGAGFAGLAAAKALKHADADVVVIDRANHNLFQPLLYQVAVLSPAQIAVGRCSFTVSRAWQFASRRVLAVELEKG